MATIGIIGGVLAILVSLGTLVGFYLRQLKDAEARGRLLQRIDNIEKLQSDYDSKHEIAGNKLACHDGDLIKVTGDIESLRDLMERMDKKLDMLIMERRE